MNKNIPDSSDATTAQTLLQHALQTGLYLGFTSIMFNALAYLLDEASLGEELSSWNIISLLIVLFICIYRGRQYAREYGYFPYGPAYTYSFVSFYTHTLLGTLWSIVLMQLIDPELSQRLLEAATLSMEESLAEGPESTEAREMGMKSIKFFMTPLGLLTSGLLGGAFWSAFISLCVALGIRSRKTED